MHRGLCKVIFLGLAIKDSEMRFTAAGQAVLKLSLDLGACNQTNDANAKSDNQRVLVIGKAAEHIGRVDQGSTVYVEGTLRTRRYITAGIQRTSIEVVVDQHGVFNMIAGPTLPTANEGSVGGTTQHQQACVERASSTRISPQQGMSGNTTDDEWLDFQGLSVNGTKDQEHL